MLSALPEGHLKGRTVLVAQIAFPRTTFFCRPLPRALASPSRPFPCAKVPPMSRMRISLMPGRPMSALHF